MSNPQNSEEVAKAIGPTLNLFVKQSAPAIQRATDDIYERLLYSVQDYLRDNAEWNLGAEIDRCRKIEAENRDLRERQWKLLATLECMCDAYELVCADSGMNYHESKSSKYAHARALIARARGDA